MLKYLLKSTLIMHWKGEIFSPDWVYSYEPNGEIRNHCWINQMICHLHFNILGQTMGFQWHTIHLQLAQSTSDRAAAGLELTLSDLCFESKLTNLWQVITSLLYLSVLKQKSITIVSGWILLTKTVMAMSMQKYINKM